MESFMKVMNIRERDDGYCDMDIELTEDEKELLLQFAIKTILSDYIEEIKGGIGYESVD
jgi:hypothetical protein